uniref:Uncharacterized protein n=1 Tax=Physcomitrium patens TaxID=3218 RepID=A0A7I4FMZ1_PHYPA
MITCYFEMFHVLPLKLRAVLALAAVLEANLVHTSGVSM